MTQFFAPRSPDPRQHQPLLNIPPATLGLLIANLVVQLVLSVLPLLLSIPPDDVIDAVIGYFGFIPARFTEVQPFEWWAIVTPITYQFLHGGWTHFLVNMVALLAFGAGVEQVTGARRMLVFSLLCGVVAAGVHFAVYPTSPVPIVGASGAISGLFGAVLRTRLALGARALWPLVALWIVMNVISGQMGMPGNPDQPIAWVAHIGGFVAGLGLIGFFRRPMRPGGWPR